MAAKKMPAIPALPAQMASCPYAGLRIETRDHASHPGADQPDVVAVLRRYAAVWESPSPFFETSWEPSPSAVQRVGSDTQAGTEIRFRYYSFFWPYGAGPWDSVRRAAALPFLSRLNHTKQLSTTHIGLNIDATHNRLAHLLGVVDLCAYLLQQVCRSPTLNRARPTRSDATATLLFALLHDAYHGPFGHSLDRIGDIILADNGHSRVDKALLEREVTRAEQELETKDDDPKGVIWQIADSVARWSAGPGMLEWALETADQRDRVPKVPRYRRAAIETLRLLITPEKLASERPDKYWLRELVDGVLDSDRIDYLLRDTHALRWHTGVDKDEVDELIKGGLRVQPSPLELAVFEDEKLALKKFNVKRIWWDWEKRKVVEDLFALRAELYTEVYEAPEKRALDEMLSHALIWILKEEIRTNPHWGARDLKLDKVLQQLTAITDDELFHFLYEIGTKPRHSLSMAIIHDLAVGRPFREAWRASIPFAELRSSQKRMRDLGGEWAAKEVGLRTSNFAYRTLMQSDPDARVLLPELRGVLAMGSDAALEALQHDFYAILYYAEERCGRSFARREILEKLLWDRILSANGDAALAKKIERALLDACNKCAWSCQSLATEDLLQRIRDTPLVFVSIPWVPPIVAEDDEEGVDDAGLVNWERQAEPLFYNRPPGSQAIDVAFRSNQGYYPISVYLPQVLAVSEDVRKLVGRLMTSLLYSLAWYRPQEALKEGYPWWGVQAPEYFQTAFVLD
jgi:HD superfamily phosphohydrolase